MYNNQNTGSHSPVNLNANYTTNEYIALNTVQAKLVNEELEYQNHRIQKNLLQQESLISRYWRSENDKQIIVNNEWDKYNHLLQNQQQFLFNHNVWRNGDIFYYQPNFSNDVISGTKEKIEIEISSRDTFNLHFVDDLNKIKDIRFDTVYVSLKSLDGSRQSIYDPNSNYGKQCSFEGILQNNFISTKYLYERFQNYSIDKKSSPVLYFIQNITTDKDHKFLANKIGKYFKHLKSDNIMVLIHNQDVADILWTSIITQIYGKHNVKVLDDKILDTQSVEEILDKILCIRIDCIPTNLERKIKLKQLITSVAIGYDRVQFFITINDADSFLEEFLSATDMIFLDSIQNIIKKMGVLDKIDLLRQIECNLDTFAKELSAIGLNPLNEYDYDNGVEKQKYLDIISKIDNYGICRNSILSPFDNNIDTVISLDTRFKHMLITGQTGSGKSELAKSLIYNDIKRNDGVVILLEPHGDLAEQVAKLPMEKERLVYIDLTLHDSMIPSMNLFYLMNKSEKEIQARAKVIVSVVKSVNDVEKFTGAMEDVLYHIVCALLREGKSDFFEVLRFLNGKSNDLIRLGKNSPNMLEKDFFMNDFDNIKPTRDAVKRRIKKLLNDPLLSNLFNGTCTIDLEQLMNTKGKVIVFKIQKSDMLDSYVYYARFIIGLIQTIVLKRSIIKEDDRVKTYCYIDEFHNFITPTIEEILTESRKYALYMTLINQSVSQIKNSALKDIILSNTNIKLIGKNSNKTLDTMNNTLNTKLEDVEKLDTGEFYLSVGTGDIIKIRNSDALLNGNADISSSEWDERKHYQLENYYRNVNDFDSSVFDTAELNQYIDDFINAIKSKDIIYFGKLKTVNLDKYEELIYNFNDGSGYIAQPELSSYFNTVHDKDYFLVNRQFIDLLKSKDFLFEQKVKQNPKYGDKFRYSIG